MRRRLPYLLLALVCAASFLPFLPALGGQWLNWDDEPNFVGNPHYRGLGPAQLKWMFTTTLLAVYIPLSWMTLGLNYVLGGMDPWGYHLGNLLLHAANAGLFFVVAGRLLAAAPSARSSQPFPTLSPQAFSALSPQGREQGEGQSPIAWGAAVAALVWAIHPLRVESVAWVTERRDVLGGLFYLLAVWAYLRAADRGRAGGGWRAASLAAFTAALLSKGITMTLPLTLLVLDAYPLRRWPRIGWRGLIREKVPYLALSALGAAVALWAVLREARWTPYGEQGPVARVAMTGYSLWFSPWKFVWPTGLSPLYEIPERVSLAEWRFLGPLLGAVLVSALLVAARERWPAGLAAWAHSVIVLAPVSGIVHAGPQLANDRFSYLSGMGFAVLAGAAAAWLARARERGALGRGVAAAAAAGATLAVLGLAAGTWEQSKVWQDSERLWLSAVGADPACVLCHNNLGNVLYGQGRFQEAELYYRRAVWLRPRLAEPHNNLGIALAAQRRHAAAEPEFREAVRLSPRLAGGLANLGALYAEQGRWAEAVPLLQQALALSPELPNLWNIAGQAFRARAMELARDGRLDEGIGLYKQATPRPAEETEILRHLGQSLVEHGAPAEAVEPLRRLVALRPQDAAARFWLARAFHLSREPAQAKREIATLRAMDPGLAAKVLQ